jgi:hypothetical protein
MTERGYDTVKSRFEALMGERQGPAIERRPVSQQEQDAAGRLLSQTAARRRRRDDEHRSLFPVRERATGASAGPAGWSRADLEDHYLATLLGAAGAAPFADIISLGHWLPILPPFDFQRTEGNGFLDDALNTGKCLTWSRDDAMSLAGVGFTVFPSADEQASISPRGTYGYTLTSIGGSPNVRSQGGLTAAVYVDDNPDPVVERHALLWNVVGVPPLVSGQQGGGQLSDAATPPLPGSFGTVPLSPLDVPFRVGHSYVVWYWCWQQCNAASADGFFATLQMTFERAHIYFSPPFVGPG